MHPDHDPDGRRIAPKPCAHYLAYEAAPGYCQCGWMRHDHRDRYIAEESRGCWAVCDTQASAHHAEPYPHVGLPKHEATRLADALNGHRIGT